ncbi:hypothetical protein [Polystyrenella longa]|uniref:hypothetical protein n=1 Tax=Polystyrenella longa TaxID=2528007 RepID=UPI0011A8D799|nr:hypothetical protein [Polystyrenella longa]
MTEEERAKIFLQLKEAETAIHRIRQAILNPQVMAELPVDRYFNKSRTLPPVSTGDIDAKRIFPPEGAD